MDIHCSPLVTHHYPDSRHPAGWPDVVLMEAQWPDLSGMECLRRVMACLKEPCIVMLTACRERDVVIESLAEGALGYLIKPVAPQYLLWAISEAAQGRPVLCSEAQAAVMDYIRRTGASKRCTALSCREREVMLGALNGTPSKDLAGELGISAGTLHKHFDNIFKKLRVHNRDEARRKFLEA